MVSAACYTSHLIDLLSFFHFEVIYFSSDNSEYPPWKHLPQLARQCSQFTSRHSIMHEISIVFSEGYDPRGNYVAAQPCSYLPNLFSCQTSCFQQAEAAGRPGADERYSCSRITLLRFRKGVSLAQSVHESLVELSGIEPLTPCLQSRCSPS